MSCEACIYSAEQLHRAYQTARKNAKQYARDNDTQVVLYQDGPDWFYITLEKAVAEGIPYREILSQY